MADAVVSSIITVASAAFGTNTDAVVQVSAVVGAVDFSTDAIALVSIPVSATQMNVDGVTSTYALVVPSKIGFPLVTVSGSPSFDVIANIIAGTQGPPTKYVSLVGRIKIAAHVFGEATPPAGVVRVKPSYEVVNAQTYRTADFVEYVDWYADGYDPLSPPIVTYANSADRNKHENPTPTNLFVKLLDNNQGYWTWTAYIDGKWTTVAQQHGTIKLSDKFFTNSTVYGWDAASENYNFDGTKVVPRDGSYEIRVLADTILDDVVINALEQNELWFSMVNFIHSCHDQVDWAFKTSFMTLVGFNESLLDAPVVQPDNTQFILSYVEEVKPYHVTVRDFARSYAPKTETLTPNMTDFDKPGYYDETNATYRTLDETNPSDREIMAGGVWQYWLNNMALARRFDVTMKLDRIWYETGSAPFANAADRIMSFYHPTTGMKPKDLESLLKLDFKGTVLDGQTFETLDATVKTTLGTHDSNAPMINGDVGDAKGFQLRDPRMALDTPEDMVRLGAHDVILLKAHDKWGAGAPRTVVKTYDVANLTDTHGDFEIGLIPRTVLVFADGQRQIENLNYVVDYLSNNVRIPLVRDSGTRIETITIHSFGYAAHTTIIDQDYHVAATDLDPTEIPVLQSVIDYGAENGPSSYYVEVTNNGRYIASTILTTSEGVQVVSFKGVAACHFVITYYKGNDYATTSLKEFKMPARANPNGDTMVISDNALCASGTYEKQHFTVDFDNRLVYVPGAASNGASHLQVKNFDSNTMYYEYSGNYLFNAPVQATTYGISQDASNIGDLNDHRVRFRAVQIRDLTTFDVKVVLGQDGLYDGAATMTGTTLSDTRIPEGAQFATLRNSLANNQVFFVFITGQTRVYDLSGNLIKDLTKDIGWTSNSFLVKLQQTAGQVQAMLINPDSPSQPVKLITLSDTYGITISDYTLTGYTTLLGSTAGSITAAAYDSVQNAVVLWFVRNAGGECVASYSMTTETFVWATWSNRSDLQIPDRFHNARGMNYSRINRAAHLVWVSDLGTHGINLRTGDYTSLNSGGRTRLGEYQHWDEKTGVLITSNQYVGNFDGPAGGEAIWRYSISFPDAAFASSFDLANLLSGELPHVKPYNSSMIVERNGLRLAPPRIYYVTNDNSFYMGEDKVDVSSLRVTDDTGMTSGVVLAADGDYNGVDEVLAANRGERFLYWKDFLVFRDSNAESRTYAVTIAGSGDFSIDDTTQTLNVYAMTSTDTIRTLHWRNDGLMLPQTWSFKARASGTYRILTKGLKGSTWLTINGRRLVEDVDYSVVPIVEGAWDFDAFETFDWDDLTEVDITIKNMLHGHDTDLVVITTFEGPMNTPAIDWQHASLTPDIVRFKHNATPADGERPFIKENGAWATESNDLRREGGLTAAEVTTGTATFDITINALSVPDVMLAPDAVTVPDAAQNVPGVVWLGAERIEYFKRQKVSSSIITLDQVRRGTKGTPKLDHPAGTPVRVEHPMRKVPAMPLGDIRDIPAPSISDKPYVPYTPPQFEGWYLKVRFYMPVRGRDAYIYGYNYSWNAYQQNPPRGRSSNWFYNFSELYEAGSPTAPECRTDNLCGQPLITLDRTGHVPDDYSSPNYQNISLTDPNYDLNPYDFTYTWYIDQPPGHHNIQLQYGAFNWGSVGKDGSPIKIMYKWWNADDWVTVVDSTIGGLWPYYWDWDVLPADATHADVQEAIDRNATYSAQDDFYDNFYGRPRPPLG